VNVLENMEIQDLNEEIQEHQGFSIENLESANWALRKIAALQKQKTENDELAQKEIDRIKLWQTAEDKKTQQSIEFFESLLTGYFIREREQDPKFKISTPYGKVTAKKQQPKWEYNDQKAIESLKAAELTELIRIKEELDKVALKKILVVTNTNVITKDGEVIEGITVTEQADKITISVG